MEAAALRLPPIVAVIAADLAKLQRPEQWQEILRNIDAVVNCAGILQSDHRQSVKAVHETGPIALFEACRQYGPSIVVHVSAISAEPDAGTEFALTRVTAERHLCASLLDWSLLRPSLVYGTGSGGGTSVIRGLAGFPWVTPLPGSGKQLFSPIHGEDLAECICRVLETRALRRQALSPVGPETLTLREIVAKTRRWLGFPRRPFLRVPLFLIRPLARLGDWISAGPIRTTSLQQMAYGNEGNGDSFAAAIGFAPRSMDQAFQQAPAYVQDRWHARLWFLRPALTVTLAMTWLGAGITGLINPPDAMLGALGRLGIPAWLATAGAFASAILDLAIGALLLSGRGDRLLAAWQLAIVLAYTMVLTLFAPALWLDPFGPLLKNVPVPLAILIWAALLERD